jgi:cell division protein FtsQ
MAHLQRVRSRAPADRGWRPAAVLAGAFLAGGALFGSWLIAEAGGESARLEAIHVRGAAHLSAYQVAAATGVTPGAALASVDSQAVVERLQTHGWIEEARALRLPTGTLLVNVRERVPAAVTTTSEAAAFYVDVSGTPFAEVAAEADDALPGSVGGVTGEVNQALPRLVSAEPVTTGEPSAALAEAVELARRLPDFGLPLPAEVSIAAEGDPEGFALRLPDRPARVVLGREDLERKLAALARLLAEELPEVGEAANLDLRFADQVVLRKQPAPKGTAQAAAARGRAAASRARPSG